MANVGMWNDYVHFSQKRSTKLVLVPVKYYSCTLLNYRWFTSNGFKTFHHHHSPGIVHMNSYANEYLVHLQLSYPAPLVYRIFAIPFKFYCNYFFLGFLKKRGNKLVLSKVTKKTVLGSYLFYIGHIEEEIDTNFWYLLSWNYSRESSRSCLVSYLLCNTSFCYYFAWQFTLVYLSSDSKAFIVDYF